MCSRHQRHSHPSLGEDNGEALSPPVAHGGAEIHPTTHAVAGESVPKETAAHRENTLRTPDESSQQDKKEKKVLNFVLYHNRC